MAQRLNSIHIQGYKSIQSQEVALRNLNVLIGANGAGKSNFISAFRFLRQIIEQRLQVTVREAGGGNRLLHLGSKNTADIQFDLRFDANHYELTLAPSQNDGLFIADENAGFQGQDHKVPLWQQVSSGTLESNLVSFKKFSDIGQYTYHALSTWRVYHFHDTSANAAVKKRCNLNDNVFLREDAANLAAFLYRIQQTQPLHYLRIVKTIQMVVPNFRDFHLRPDPLNEQTILLEWESTESDYIFSASELSDGSLRFICIAVMLLQPEPPELILLDEPELGLHPAAINILAGLLQKVAVRAQIIVSTQSSALVSQFEPEDIIIVEQHNNQTTFKRLDGSNLDQWLENYTLGALWEKNVIGGRP